MNSTITRSWLFVIPLLLFAWLAHFCVDIMLGIWPVYKSLAQLDLAKAGFVVAIGAFIGEGCQLVVGVCSDRGYRKLMMVIGLILATAASFFVYSNRYEILFIFYLITCIGSACFHPAAASVMSSIIPTRRGLLMTIFASGGSLGLATSQLIFTNTYHFFEGQTFVLAIPAIVLALGILFYRFPEGPISTVSRQSGLRDFLEFFKTPSLRSLYISQVANQSILWGTIFILPDALKTLGHHEWICYGGGHLCFIIGGAFMMIPAGFLADAYSPRQVMLYAGFISTVAFYVILYFGGISSLLVLFALFILGASLALINPVAISFGTHLEPHRPGAISAFLMGLVWCISESLGPGGVGFMSQWFENYAPVKALATLGCLFLVQIYATICLPRKEAVMHKIPISQ